VIPAYLTPAQIAEANEMTTEKCRRKLARAGILERDGNHRWHVAESRLRERLPDMFERVFAATMFEQAETSTDKRRAG
jgi:hypothetical protein